MSLLGFHIDGLELAGNTAIREQVKRTKSNWHLVMDDKNYARDLLPHVKKGIVYRAFDPFSEVGRKGDFDNDFWQRHDPIKTANWMQAYLSDMAQEGFYLTAGNNEPSSDPGNRLKLIKWLTDLMHELRKRNIRGAIGEIAVAKTLEMNEIQAGWWDDFLRTLYQYRDWHILTIHEYSTGVLPANFIHGYPQNLLDKSVADKSKWVKQIPSGYAGNYHLGRWHWLEQRARDIGVPIQRVVITECALDYMEDNNANGKWLKEVLRPMFNYNGFEGLKGWEGHKPYWHWLGVQDWQQFMYEQMAWFAQACLPQVEGLCMFALNYDWYEWEGVDLSREGVAHFRHLVETQPVNRTPTPPAEPPKEYDMIPITITGYRDSTQTANKVNIRNSPSTAASIVGVLPAYPTVTTGYVADSEPVFSNGFSWQFYELSIDSKVVSGYIAQEFVKEVSEPAPDTKLFYDLNGATLHHTATEHAKLIADIRWLASVLDSIEGTP